MEFDRKKRARFYRKKGFSIVEMIVATALFSMVAVVAMSSILSLVNANEKTRTTRTALDNLGFTIEDITRNLRFGRNFYCQESDDPISITTTTTKKDCPNGGSYLAFEDRTGIINLYRYDSGAKCIQKKITSVYWGSRWYVDTLPPTLGHGYVCISSPDVEITKLKFHVFDEEPGNQVQRVAIVIQGFTGLRTATRSSFNLMTSVSARKAPLSL